jgi:hypothetical protein
MPAAGKANCCIPATLSSAVTRSPLSKHGCRKHATLPAAATVKRGQRVEHEYERGGALCYFAAWDAKRAKLFDRCDEKDGILPFDKLIEQFMTVEPYSNARRVFVIADNAQRTAAKHRSNASKANTRT